MEMIHRNAGWDTASAANGEEAISRLQEGDFDIVYLDLALPGKDGIEILQDVKVLRPDQIVVILTGQASVEKAVKATQLGAFDFLEKDCGKEKILLTSHNALKLRNLSDENKRLRDRDSGRQEFLGTSDDYMESFFGIDEKQSINSGYKKYNAESGIKDVNITVSAGYKITSRWRIGATVGYKRLVGDAADSPIVDDKNQMFAGFGLSYHMGSKVLPEELQ